MQQHVGNDPLNYETCHVLRGQLGIGIPSNFQGSRLQSSVSSVQCPPVNGPRAAGLATLGVLGSVEIPDGLKGEVRRGYSVVVLGWTDYLNAK